eukprot:15455697-Alexandrium_andersonii.AAC.1
MGITISRAPVTAGARTIISQACSFDRSAAQNYRQTRQAQVQVRAGAAPKKSGKTAGAKDKAVVKWSRSRDGATPGTWVPVGAAKPP